MVNIKITDVVPAADSTEADQNSEPSLAADPLDPNAIIVGSSGGSTTPYFLSTNGGLTWTSYGALDTLDKTLAWSQDETTILSSILTSTEDLSTYSGTTAGSTFNAAPINTGSLGNLDQPWLRTGPSNHVYLAYNNLNPTDGKTASIDVSNDGGVTFTPVVIDRVGGTSGQDAPAVRVAVSGNTGYGAFTRWNATVDNDTDGESDTRRRSWWSAPITPVQTRSTHWAPMALWSATPPDCLPTPRTVH